MKIVDITAFNIVKPGIEFEIQSSTVKDDGSVAKLLPDMERNEGAVFWLEPKGGTVEQQEACICVNGVYYALNSKFEKAIFRNVRLTRDFKNYERLVDGKTKLVIPRRLFSEKLRTSRRVSDPEGLPSPPRLSACMPRTRANRVERLTLFPQNLSLMKRLEIKHQPLEPPAPENASAAQQAACQHPPSALVESTPETSKPANRASETARPKQEFPQKLKRKKRKFEVENVLDVAERLLNPHRDSFVKSNTENCPPLLHTPHSLFSMLHDTFEREFPNVLPQEAIEIINRTLKKTA